MGEIALRKIQAGLEATRGTVVAASRNVYGVMTIQREQPRRYANEDRGVFIKYFRANPKLIQAGFKLDGDLTFEDYPYFLEMALQGGITPSGSSAQGWLWSYSPDLSSDLIKTRTLYAGDDTVQWRGAFGVADKLDVTIGLDDAVKMELEGFVQDWIPVTSGFLTTGFSSGFAALADRTVESMMGYQSKLFVDSAGGTIGTTQITGKFISAKLGFHLNNKRKPFGDGLNYALQKLGRGERDVSCDFVFEGKDQQEFADHFNNVEKLIRIQLLGTAIAGSNFGTVNGAITQGTVVTSLVTNALTAAIPGGVGIIVGGQAFTVAPAGAAGGALAVPVISQAVNVVGGILNGATIQAVKTINHDLYGFWDSFAPGSRETNTTWGMKLMGVADPTAGLDHKVIVVNQNNLAAGIS